MYPYLQITTICNFKCKHCCFNCTSRGLNMSLKTAKKAVNTCCDYGAECITIGGGEPTLHPKFWEILGIVLSKFSSENIFMVTNGSQKETTLRLASMAKNGLISVAVSNDKFHPPLDEEIKNAFTKKIEFNSTSNDFRSFHGASNPIIAGRCKKGKDDCCCEGPLIKPNGRVYQCGCNNSPLIGNCSDFTSFFNDKIDIDDEWGCYRQSKNKD